MGGTYLYQLTITPDLYQLFSTLYYINSAETWTCINCFECTFNSTWTCINSYPGLVSTVFIPTYFNMGVCTCINCASTWTCINYFQHCLISILHWHGIVSTVLKSYIVHKQYNTKYIKTVLCFPFTIRYGWPQIQFYLDITPAFTIMATAC